MNRAEGDKLHRYVIWRRTERGRYGGSLVELLEKVPAVRVLRSSSPDEAVVVMDVETEEKIRALMPDVVIEPDIRFRPAVQR